MKTYKLFLLIIFFAHVTFGQPPEKDKTEFDLSDFKLGDKISYWENDIKKVMESGDLEIYMYMNPREVTVFGFPAKELFLIFEYNELTRVEINFDKLAITYLSDEDDYNDIIAWAKEKTLLSQDEIGNMNSTLSLVNKLKYALGEPEIDKRNENIRFKWSVDNKILDITHLEVKETEIPNVHLAFYLKSI